MEGKHSMMGRANSRAVHAGNVPKTLSDESRVFKLCTLNPASPSNCIDCVSGSETG